VRNLPARRLLRQFAEPRRDKAFLRSRSPDMIESFEPNEDRGSGRADDGFYETPPAI
jgi:hypothetical protein